MHFPISADIPATRLNKRRAFRGRRRASASVLALAALSLAASPAPVIARSAPVQASAAPVAIQPPSSAENPAPAPVTSAPVPPVQTTILPPSIPPVGSTIGGIAGPTMGAPAYPSAQQQPLTGTTVGQPQDPLTGAPRAAEAAAVATTVDPATDPILSAALRSADAEDFRNLVVAAVRQHPALDENAGYAVEARYARDQQRAGYYPSAEIDLPGFQVLGRQFGQDDINDNIVERTRADRRFDMLGIVNQLVTDFGATSNRVKAAGARLRAAALGVDNAADQVALNTIAAWYDVYALRTVLALTESYRADAELNRGFIAQRIKGGASAPADAALIENAIANLDIRVARFRQQLASAEARFRELTGASAPAGLLRAPELGDIPASITAARDEAGSTAAARAARFQAEAANRDAKAAKRDLLPNVSVSLNAGRYGLIERDRDYDVVGRITLRQRFFGGLPERAKGAQAHAGAMEARAARIAQEGARDAETAWSDLEALEEQRTALEASYVATLRTRNATVERFRFSRGTLFDVVNASDTFYAAAAGYIQALAQRDAARYVLLSRTGRLLDAFGIQKYEVGKTVR